MHTLFFSSPNFAGILPQQAYPQKYPSPAFSHKKWIFYKNRTKKNKKIKQKKQTKQKNIKKDIKKDISEGFPLLEKGY